MLDKGMQRIAAIGTVKPLQRLRHLVRESMQFLFYRLLFIQILALFIHVALLLPCDAGVGGTPLCKR